MLALALLVVAVPSVSAEEWQVVREVRTRSMPWGVTVSPDGERLWVTHVGMRDRDNVYRYDAATLEVVARSRFRGHAVESVLRGDTLYVSNSRKDRIMVLDAGDLSVRRTLATDSVPKQIALSRDGKTLYVANWSGGSVNIIATEGGDTRSTGYSGRRLAPLRSASTPDVRSIATGRHTRGVAVSRDGTTLYAAVFGARRVAVVDLARGAVTHRIRACKYPRHVAVTRDDRHVLISCFGRRHVLAIDRKTHRVSRRIAVGRGPKTIALSPDGRLAVTANERGNSISFIDLATWKARSVPVPGQQPCGATFSPDGERLYITARGSDELIVFARLR